MTTKKIVYAGLHKSVYSCLFGGWANNFRCNDYIEAKLLSLTDW